MIEYFFIEDKCSLNCNCCDIYVIFRHAYTVDDLKRELNNFINNYDEDTFTEHQEFIWNSLRDISLEDYNEHNKDNNRKSITKLINDLPEHILFHIFKDYYNGRYSLGRCEERINDNYLQSLERNQDDEMPGLLEEDEEDNNNNNNNNNNQSDWANTSSNWNQQSDWANNTSSNWNQQEAINDDNIDNEEINIAILLSLNK